QQNKKISLPSGNSINYEVCLSTLNEMFRLYNWENAEKPLRNISSLRYYALLMNQWINGFPLNQIISQSLDWKKNNNGTVRIDFDRIELFQAGDKTHVNFVIEEIIEKIEYVLRFLFEKYFNHYY